ncbi:MAG: hypothetical protein HGA78_04850, partial [Nitrospirales bacterium]|nr:hypothetical protein [Nitrospirales bacterium]
ERSRGLYVLKSRGMAHSSQIRELMITGAGLDLRDVYIGAGGILAGSARDIQEMKAKAEEMIQRQEIERLKKELGRRKALTEEKIKALRLEFEAEKDELMQVISREELKEDLAGKSSVKLSRIRQSGATSPQKDRAQVTEVGDVAPEKRKNRKSL